MEKWDPSYKYVFMLIIGSYSYSQLPMVPGTSLKVCFVYSIGPHWSNPYLNLDKDQAQQKNIWPTPGKG